MPHPSVVDINDGRMRQQALARWDRTKQHSTDVKSATWMVLCLRLSINKETTMQFRAEVFISRIQANFASPVSCWVALILAT